MVAFTPAAAAPTARDAATLPVEAQLTVRTPLRTACSKTSAVARSLFDPVGVRVSSLSHRSGTPVASCNRDEATSGVSPIASGYVIGPSSIGSKPRYRLIPSAVEVPAGSNSGLYA